jgi:hypothetical protein
MMDDLDANKLMDQQWQAELDALAAHDAEWRKYFALQSTSELKARPELPNFETSHAE